MTSSTHYHQYVVNKLEMNHSTLKMILDARQQKHKLFLFQKLFIGHHPVHLDILLLQNFSKYFRHF